MAKRPVEESTVSRETWRKFLNPEGWKVKGKLVDSVGSRKWCKIPKPTDAKARIGYQQVQASGKAV